MGITRHRSCAVKRRGAERVRAVTSRLKRVERVLVTSGKNTMRNVLVVAVQSMVHRGMAKAVMRLRRRLGRDSASLCTKRTVTNTDICPFKTSLTKIHESFFPFQVKSMKFSLVKKNIFIYRHQMSWNRKNTY